MKKIVKTISLKPDPRLIHEYCKIHQNIWPEIKEGIKLVGIDNMEIYLHGSIAVMIVEMDDKLDSDVVFDILAKYPRQEEWEAYVSKFQECCESDTSAEKWKEMDKIFSLK